MRKIPLLIFIFLNLLFLNLGMANACSCLELSGPKESVESATSVFIGKAIEVDSPKSLFGLSSNIGQDKVTFEVSKSYKAIGSKIITITTSASSASCGYSFFPDKEYLVYTYGLKDNLKVSLCSRTQLLANAGKDLIELGEGNIITATDENLKADNSKNILSMIFNIYFLPIIGLIVIILIIYFRKCKKTKKGK